MLTELPDKQKYYAMALTDLRDASNAATLAWTRAVIDERNRRSQELGEAATQKDREDIINDLLKNATPAIMDLISVATWIEDIYRERLEKATEEVLSRATLKAKIDGLIDLLGMKLMKPGQPQPNQVTIGIEEFGKETITFAPGTLSLSEEGEKFFRENWTAIVKELQRRERAEAKKQARRAGKLVTGLQPLNGVFEAYQGPLTHQFSRRHMKGDPENPGLFDHLLDDFGKGTIQAQGMTIYIDNYNEAIKKLDEDSSRLIDLAAAKAKQTNSNEIFFSTAEYMRIRELKDPYKARQELKTAKEGLYAVSIRIEAAKGQNETQTNDFRLFQETADDGGTNIGLKYSDKAFKILRSYVQPFDMDMRVFPLDGLSYSIYRRLLEHKTINARKTRQGEDPTLKPEDKISIKTILEGTRLPTKEQVLQKYGPKLSEKILQPFERSMEKLVDAGILREWYYIGVNDAKADPPKNYRQFEGLNIRFFLDMEPDTEKLEEYRERQEKLFEAERKRAEKKAVRKIVEAKNKKLENY